MRDLAAALIHKMFVVLNCQSRELGEQLVRLTRWSSQELQGPGARGLCAEDDDRLSLRNNLRLFFPVICPLWHMDRTFRNGL